MTRSYAVVLLPDLEVGGFTVTCPTLPGVVTEGDDRDEALSNAGDAIALILEERAAVGLAIPPDDPPTSGPRVTVDVPA